MVRIEDCPFCGEAGKMKDIATPFRHGWVGCPECKVYISWKVSPKHAIATWNRRTKCGEKNTE